jgi:hypothetical protein
MDRLRTFNDEMKKTKVQDEYFRQLLREASALLDQLSSAIARHDTVAEATLAQRASELLGMMDQRLARTSVHGETSYAQLRGLIADAIATEENDQPLIPPDGPIRATGEIVDRVYDDTGRAYVVQRSGGEAFSYPVDTLGAELELGEIATIESRAGKAIVTRDRDRERNQEQQRGGRTRDLTSPLATTLDRLRPSDGMSSGPGPEISHLGVQ